MANNNDYYDYQQSLNPEINYDRFHFFDYVLIGISIVSVLAAIVFGVIEQNQVNEITKKDNDITEVIKALDMYYVDSNKIPSEQTYPLALCNGRPNEVDFEFTLKNALAGDDKSKNTFAYIDKKNFPIDTSGEYNTKISDKKVKLRDCSRVFGSKKIVDYIYPNQDMSCSFDKDNADPKYKNCYIYSTDTLGFEYKIGYYDQYKNYFVIYTKVRNQPLQKNIS
jgi:type II secretory pathway pseudopilin PulG